MTTAPPLRAVGVAAAPLQPAKSTAIAVTLSAAAHDFAPMPPLMLRDGITFSYESGSQRQSEVGRAIASARPDQIGMGPAFRLRFESGRCDGTRAGSRGQFG